MTPTSLQDVSLWGRGYDGGGGNDHGSHPAYISMRRIAGCFLSVQCDSPGQGPIMCFDTNMHASCLLSIVSGLKLIKMKWNYGRHRLLLYVALYGCTVSATRTKGSFILQRLGPMYGQMCMQQTLLWDRLCMNTHYLLIIRVRIHVVEHAWSVCLTSVTGFKEVTPVYKDMHMYTTIWDGNSVWITYFVDMHEILGKSI